MKNKVNLFVLIFIFSLILLFTIFYKTDEKHIARQLEVDDLKIESLNYLKSYDNPEIEVTSNDLIFNANKKLNSLSGVELLSETNLDLTEYLIDFKTTYIKDIGLVYMRVYLKREDNLIDQINVTGYSFFNKNINKNDVSFEYFGETILASDLIDNKIDNQGVAGSRFFVMQMVDGGGGSSSSDENSSSTGGNSSSIENNVSCNETSVDVTMPILEISLAIINSKKDLVHEEINRLKLAEPVNFWIDGPISYILWHVKKDKALSNYEHNRKLSIPLESTKDGYIVDQLLFDEWKYGFQNLKKTGCGIISLYNFLVSQGRTTDLASLILLAELMNADLAFGFLGTNPFSKDFIKLISLHVKISVVKIQPLLHLKSPIIAGIITKRLISYELETAQRWWQKILIWASMPSQYLITLRAVNIAIDAIALATDLIIELYLKQIQGIPDILNVLGYKKLDVSYFNYDKFSQNAEGYGYFIMAFFNKVPDFSNPITLYNNGAHLIFVKRKYKNKNELIAYNNGTEETNKGFFAFYGEKETKDKKFISGVIIKG